MIDVPIEASAGRDLGGEHALITLAEQTGGKYFYVSDGGLDKAFATGERRPAHAISARATIRRTRSRDGSFIGYR